MLRFSSNEAAELDGKSHRGRGISRGYMVLESVFRRLDKHMCYESDYCVDRYPGCRFDSESYTYAFFFSKEMLDEWDWKEHFAPQPETERYIRFMCDKLDLWDTMQFNTRITKAHWIAEDNCWRLTDLTGKTYTSRFLITGIGLLSNPTLPNVPGVEEFTGIAYHTSRWPKEEVSFEGKRVGIIGEIAPMTQIHFVSQRNKWHSLNHR